MRRPFLITDADRCDAGGGQDQPDEMGGREQTESQLGGFGENKELTEKTVQAAAPLPVSSSGPHMVVRQVYYTAEQSTIKAVEPQKNFQ